MILSLNIDFYELMFYHFLPLFLDKNQKSIEAKQQIHETAIPENYLNLSYLSENY